MGLAEGVLNYLEQHEPEHVDTALRAFRCFEPYGPNPFDYTRSIRLVPEGCEQEVVQLLRTLRDEADAGNDAPSDAEARFVAAQNAEVAAGAERYYRSVLGGGGQSWNVRDCHMVDTLDRLVEHHGTGTKAVVWAHNTHIGDARATDMGGAGMVNVGQLVRERHADEGVVAVGFGTHRGSVIASDRWGGAVLELTVPPAAAASTETLLHRAAPDQDSLFVFPGGDSARRRSLRDTAFTSSQRANSPTSVPRASWCPSSAARRSSTPTPSPSPSGWSEE